MKKLNRMRSFVLILILTFIFSSIDANARNARKDLNNDFTDAEREELCGLVDQWLTTWLISFHGDDFGRMHTTNDYLRWHRDHFIDLEMFLTEQGKSKYVPFPKWNPANPVPSFFNGFRADGVTPFVNSSNKCIDPGGNGCRAGEDYINTNPGYKFNQNGQFNANLPLQNRWITSNVSGFLCNFNTTVTNWPPQTTGSNVTRTFNFTDVADFSDNHQFRYHDAGHVAFDIVAGGTTIQRSQMGTLVNNRAAGVFIFWAWHAWVDDMWWNWDACHIENNGTTITGAYDNANGLTISSGSTVSFGISGDVKKIQGKVIIQAGATLIIENGQIIEMLDDYYTNQDCGFEVQAGVGGNPGGKLIIKTGAIIRGITSLGIHKTGVGRGARISTDRSFTNIYPDAKVMYLSQWPGIVVKGDASKNAFDVSHGQVLIDGSATSVLIQNAKTAITSENGGIIKCQNAVFRNCSTSLEFKSYLSPSNNDESASSISLTTFEVTDQLSRYFTNDNMYMHYFHDFHRLVHVRMTDVRGIEFAGCKFLNNDPRNSSTYSNVMGSHNNAKGTGIKSINSTYALHNDGVGAFSPTTQCIEYPGSVRCEFKNLSFAIDAINNTPVTTEIAVKTAIFTNNHDAIVISDANNVKIFKSTFSYDIATALFPLGTPLSHMHFINSFQNAETIIYGNDFTNNEPTSEFIEIENITSKHKVSKVQLNTFTNNPITLLEAVAVKLEGDNMLTDVKCNTFSGKFEACIYNFGTLKTQGSSTLSAGNIFLEQACITSLEQHLKNDAGATGYIYFFKNPLLSSEDPTCRSSGITKIGSNISPNDDEELRRCELSCIGRSLAFSSINVKGGVKIYPNPANTIFNIELEEPEVKGIIKLYDFMGRLILTQSIETSLTKIDITKFPKGIYQVIIEKQGNLIASQKLIVQ